MALKVITIDFWNTLFDSSKGIERNNYRQRSLVNEIDKLDVMVRQEEFNDAMKASWEFFNNIWVNEQRTPATIETVSFFWDYLKLPYSEESINEVVKGFSDSILVHPPALIDGVKEALEVLSKEYKLAIVSDTGFSPGIVLKELLEKAGILHYFSAFSFSDETGVSKPHEKAFNTCLEALKCKPENAMHIGDIEKTDVVGAKALGMMAIRFTGDETGILNKKDSGNSLADLEAVSWAEILEFINSLQQKEAV